MCFKEIACAHKGFREAAHIVDCAADCAFHVTAGCMLAQTNHEINFRAIPNAGIAVAVPIDGQPVPQATTTQLGAAPSPVAANPLKQTLLSVAQDMER